MRISQPGSDLMAPRHKEIKMLINCLYETIFRHFYILLEGIHDLLLSAVKSFYPFYGPAALDTEIMVPQVSGAPPGVTRAMWSQGLTFVMTRLRPGSAPINIRACVTIFTWSVHWSVPALDAANDPALALSLAVDT